MATMVNDLHPAILVDAVDVAVYTWASPSTALPLILPALAYIPLDTWPPWISVAVVLANALAIIVIIITTYSS